MLQFLKVSFTRPLLLLYPNDLPNDAICNIVIYADDTTFYSECDHASKLWLKLELAFKFKSDRCD